MSTSLSSIFLLVLFLYRFPSSSSLKSFGSPLAATSSFVTTKQQAFWSKYVLNHMPQTLLPKLSPLTVTESMDFASLLSGGSIESNTNFCTLANLACAANLSSVRILDQEYLYIEGTISTHLEKVDKHSFFKLQILEEGNRVYVPLVHDSYPHRSFLPQGMASIVSLNMRDLKKLFPQSFRYKTTEEAIQLTLSYCNASTLQGETKRCFTSLEEMITFAKDALGKKHMFALTSKSVKGSANELTIAKVKKLGAEKIVSCHDVFLPFSTYFCHVLSSTRLYVVDVVDSETRPVVKTVFAVCHMDTLTWPKNHVAFKILNSSPGKGETCHWMTTLDLVLIGDGVNIMAND